MTETIATKLLNEPQPTTIGSETFQWWYAMQQDLTIDKKGDLKNLAMLRRARTIRDASESIAPRRLYQRLEAFGVDSDTCLVLSLVIAPIRSSNASSRRVGAVLGGGNKDRPLMSNARFRSLQSSSDPVRLVHNLRTAIALARGTMPIDDMAESTVDFCDPLRAKERWIKWSFDYFGQQL